MMVHDKRPKSALNNDSQQYHQEAGCLYALITDKRPVSRRNRASWYLSQLNKIITLEQLKLARARLSAREGLSTDLEENDDESLVDSSGPDINLVSIVRYNRAEQHDDTRPNESCRQFLVTPNTRVMFLSRSIATSIILDLSPSVVSVSSQSNCVLLDSMFDALKRVLHLLVMSHEVPDTSGSKPLILEPKVFLSVVAYTPFVVAKNNQVLIQNRRISSSNINQVLVELWICLSRLTQETHDLVSSTCGMNLEFETTKSDENVFVFPQPINGIIRHPGAVLEDMYEISLFSSSLMPRRSRLSVIIISDGLFASTNNLSVFRLKSIAVSFVSLGPETNHFDSCFGYTPYVDLMRFISKTTLGVYISYHDLANYSQSISQAMQVPLLSNPLHKLFCWTLHSETDDHLFCYTPRGANFPQLQPIPEPIESDLEHISKLFYVDQPSPRSQLSNEDGSNLSIGHSYHDWRSFRQLDRNLDADFEQVLSCLLREGYLIKNIQFKHKETSIITARLVLHWRHNLDLEHQLTAPYWDPFDMKDSSQLRVKPSQTPIYGDTYCELIVHGSYSFLHNLYCNRRTKRRTEFRDTSYRQFRHLIEGVLQTYERLQYLSQFYNDSSLSKVPSFLLHGNSLLYEQPHTHRLTSTIDNIMEEGKTSEFQEYWQKISCLDTKSWKNLMHIHTLRLVLEHDQPKHKNIHYQNVNGRYTHVQCRRALSAISTFIKSYSSFALLEDTTYIKFIFNRDDDLREIETSATKGFIVIRINKLLPILVIYLMFTSGILDSHRIQIVSYIEEQLTNCKLRIARNPSVSQIDNILKSKTISPSSEACCILIKSPLERMLKVYSRNFVNDFLVHNWAHGLPGSCPYNTQQLFRVTAPNSDLSGQQRPRSETDKEQPEEYTMDSSVNRYNLVFGKYLYGVRAIQTISDLPQDVVSSLTANVISKISAILVNSRIRQGFHIAFNNSGILNLVVELAMKDISNQDHESSCLCQYIVFPPTVINCNPTMQAVLTSHTTGVSSKPTSCSGSLGISESHQGAQDSIQNMRGGGGGGEIKVVREYWIEQQYGLSAESEGYHHSLSNLRYPEIVDHLFATDATIFECLLTYELLQLFCDKLSLYHDLDSYVIKNKSKGPMVSPTMSTTSSNTVDDSTAPARGLPSKLIEGNSKDGYSKVPLFEKEYRFRLVKFLDHCQLASLNVLLFKDRSDFYEQNLVDTKEKSSGGITNERPLNDRTNEFPVHNKFDSSRKMSVDIKNDFEERHSRKEHRSSYQYETHYSGFQSPYNPLSNQSLNHMFLETMHKRLKQMHDKEIRISDYDRERLPNYLRRRSSLIPTDSSFTKDPTFYSKLESTLSDPIDFNETGYNQPKTSQDCINWRCFLRKGNQENLMIVFIPATLTDVNDWLDSANNLNRKKGNRSTHDPICPIFVFRCSSTMINDRVLSCLKMNGRVLQPKSDLEMDLSLHLGQPCKYMGKLRTFNDELSVEMLPIVRYGALNQTFSDEKTLEVVHFRAFLRKVKNTVLKSRFSSLNDAYLSEIFIHRDDILYYMNNLDLETQKKYHISSQLKNLSEFIKSYEDYIDSLPQEPRRPCNQLLNSILLQKCGLFINQPIARFDESNPLMRQIHDKKLLNLIRCNYKVDLPILEESLASSKFLSRFVRSSVSYAASSTAGSNINLSSTSSTGPVMNKTTSSLGKTDGTRLMEIKCGSVGATGSPSGSFSERFKVQPRFGSSSTLNGLPSSFNENFILEAFRGTKICPIEEIPADVFDMTGDASSRHEAHMAEVLRRTGERRESHHYRRVLKSKANYSQSHSAIDQALRRVDSLGRLEHFCLTPLLFSPSWRSKLAPVRDHTIETDRVIENDNYIGNSPTRTNESGQDSVTETGSPPPEKSQQPMARSEDDDRWHQTVCNNYIKEYEQYIQTLGFNSVQVRCQSNTKGAAMPQSSSAIKRSPRKTSRYSSPQVVYHPDSYSARSRSKANETVQLRHESFSTSNTSLSASSSTYNTGYLIKFLNSGCLVFKVGFCKPYVYSILYSIEGERFNNSNMKLNMAAFLDELDNIKVTMHLHSFTYDYHLRSMYSYISGRQMTFSPGYHLISFLDDFRKYYQKAPNYARNHILCGEVCVTNIKVTGQQLYNYMVTHNSVYNMEVLEMSCSISNNTASSIGRSLNENPKLAPAGLKELTLSSSHANDYVLIELKREKVRYRDGKDPDIFDCGLLITHDFQNDSSSKDCLTLKYFLMLTNQRDLYPKLIHTYDNIISLGCHRPIRIGVPQQVESRQAEHKTAQVQTSDQDDVPSSELQSSDEISGPQSIISTNSIHSSSSGLQFGYPSEQNRAVSNKPSIPSQELPEIKVDRYEDKSEAPRSSLEGSTNLPGPGPPESSVSENDPLVSSSEDTSYPKGGTLSRRARRRKDNSTSSSRKNADSNAQIERTICDEEITYLGYFSSDEMDMLKFLKEKTTNLQIHVEHIVRLAEIHYCRDYLWHKLMQRTVSNTKQDELPLTVEELIQLLKIVDTIDLASLDPQLSTFTTMHINWYSKLLKAFGDLRQSSSDQHRIYTVKASRLLLLYIDPNCTVAFILLAIDSERGSVELNMLIKNKQELSKTSDKAQTKSSHDFELDKDCQQLVNDFINFCAAFMWSTLLT